MFKLIYILSFVILISSPLKADNKISDCSEITKKTGTMRMEIIISDKEVCMGDTSMDPMCANIDGKPNNWIKHEKQKGNYAIIKITQNEYYFKHFLVNKVSKTIRLNRYTGKSTVTYFDLENGLEKAIALFKCEKVKKKLF